MIGQVEKKQIKVFKQTARELECDESPDAMDKVMGKLDLKSKPERDSSDSGEKPKSK